MQKNTLTTIELDKKEGLVSEAIKQSRISDLNNSFIKTITEAFKEGKKISDYFEERLRTSHSPMGNDYFRELSIVRQRSILSQRTLDSIESIITNYETRLRSIQTSSKEEQ